MMRYRATCRSSGISTMSSVKRPRERFQCRAGVQVGGWWTLADFPTTCLGVGETLLRSENLANFEASPAFQMPSYADVRVADAGFFFGPLVGGFAGLIVGGVPQFFSSLPEAMSFAR